MLTFLFSIKSIRVDLRVGSISFGKSLNQEGENDKIPPLKVEHTVRIYKNTIYPTRYVAYFIKIYLAIYRRGGIGMNIKEAVEKRVIELCNERNIAINALANIAGVPPSTVYSMLNEKSKNPGVVSIKKICDGLEISIREFFDSDLFDDLEQEIK